MTIESSHKCLTADSLRQLAHDKLSTAELSDIEQHVTECGRCRGLLAAAESDPQWRDEIFPVLRHADDSPRLAGHLGDGEPEDHDGESLDAVLRLLGPTDDPRMLGRIGSYEVVGVIGRGGMGIVFKAFDAPLNRFVAIKMLLPHLAASGAARKRFAREGQAAAAVIDDHVMPIYSVAEWQGLPYLVTQYCGGATLQKRIEQQGPLHVREILRIAVQSARGLAAAHAQGLVHRDVKPSNILLDGTVERAMLTDFGLARAVDDASITRTGIIAGTPQYMSPEQARGRSVDARSDLFGLGSVMYAMCTGRPPFRADNSHAILRLVTDEEPRPIRELNAEIPDWLCAIISKLMSKQPDDRFASAEEVAELLEDCLAHVQQPTTGQLPWQKLPPCDATRRVGNLPSTSRLRDWRLFVGVALSFVLVLAGILIVLELDKGQLRIQSEADDVPIRIVQGNEVVEELTVSKSGKTVRIAAGRYQVEIDGNIDGIAVSDGAVTLKRGGQEAVKIVRSERDGLAARDLQLDGAWEVVHTTQDQQEVSFDRVRWRFDTKAGTVTTESHDESLRSLDRVARMTLNPDSSPKQLTLWDREPATQMIAIYEIEGDTLRIAMFSGPVAERPTSFTSKSRSGAGPLMVLSLKRIAQGISFHLAEFEPAADLTEYTVPDSDRKVYVAKQPFATSQDIAAARVIGLSDGKPAIEIYFDLRANLARSIDQVTQQHINKPVAILVDGKLLSAPTIRERFGGTAVITGQFSRAEAEWIAKAIHPGGQDGTNRSMPENVQSTFTVPVEVYTDRSIPVGDLAGPIVPWGEESNGLSASLRVVPDEMKVELWVRNSGTKPVTFRHSPRVDVGLVVTVTDKDGQTHKASLDAGPGWRVFGRVFLPPGHVVKVKEFDVQLESTARGLKTRVPVARVPPAANGPLRLRATWTDTLQTPPGEGEWTGQLTTGALSNGPLPPVAQPNGAAPDKSLDAIDFWSDDQAKPISTAKDKAGSLEAFQKYRDNATDLLHKVIKSEPTPQPPGE